MKCRVYKGSKKTDTYLYVDTKTDQENVPESLLVLLGELNQVVDFDLTPERQLAQADSRQVLEQIRKQGFYLQLPPGDGPATC